MHVDTSEAPGAHLSGCLLRLHEEVKASGRSWKNFLAVLPDIRTEDLNQPVTIPLARFRSRHNDHPPSVFVPGSPGGPDDPERQTIEEVGRVSCAPGFTC